MNNKIERVWKEAAMAQDSRLRYYTRFAYRGWVNHETLSQDSHSLRQDLNPDLQNMKQEC
jgi:hypothetical protein